VTPPPTGYAGTMKRTATAANAIEERLKKLAAGIEAMAEKDALAEEHARAIAATRIAAAAELYGICVEFVASLNRLLARQEVIIDPPENTFHSHDFEHSLIQINVRGRILQIEYAPTSDLISTEEFRVPYTLAGSVRAFNQELLDKDLIEEQLIFFTFEKHGWMWRFFDPRTYRSGPLDREYLICVMEQLI